MINKCNDFTIVFICFCQSVHSLSCDTNLTFVLVMFFIFKNHLSSPYIFTHTVYTWDSDYPSVCPVVLIALSRLLLLLFCINFHETVILSIKGTYPPATFITKRYKLHELLPFLMLFQTLLWERDFLIGCMLGGIR